ncbi:MAG: hypothetical protein IK115_07305 [Lachnospiraceae bacterium]|nr:hypothetical protein [Lachnospiraceae bacterium]
MTDTAEIRRKERIRNLRTLSRTQTVSVAAAGRRRSAVGGVLHRYRSVFLALAIFVLGSSVSQRLSTGPGDYVLAEHLEETALSLTAADGTKACISMGELAYYILRIEREGDRQARAYNPEDPSAYWKLRLSTKEQASYVSQMAKKTVLDYAERDLLYSLEAGRAGLSLDDEEKKACKNEAERMWLKMSDRERESTGLDVETLTAVMEREKLSERMMKQLSAEGIPDNDVGSEYYTGLLGSYTAERSQQASEELRVGYVSIN